LGTPDPHAWEFWNLLVLPQMVPFTFFVPMLMLQIRDLTYGSLWQAAFLCLHAVNGLVTSKLQLEASVPPTRYDKIDSLRIRIMKFNLGARFFSVSMLDVSAFIATKLRDGTRIPQNLWITFLSLFPGVAVIIVTQRLSQIYLELTTGRESSSCAAEGGASNLLPLDLPPSNAFPSDFKKPSADRMSSPGNNGRSVLFFPLRAMADAPALMWKFTYNVVRFWNIRNDDGVRPEQKIAVARSIFLLHLWMQVYMNLMPAIVPFCAADIFTILVFLFSSEKLPVPGGCPLSVTGTLKFETLRGRLMHERLGTVLSLMLLSSFLASIPLVTWLYERAAGRSTASTNARN